MKNFRLTFLDKWGNPIIKMINADTYYQDHGYFYFNVNKESVATFTNVVSVELVTDPVVTTGFAHIDQPEEVKTTITRSSNDEVFSTSIKWNYGDATSGETLHVSIPYSDFENEDNTYEPIIDEVHAMQWCPYTTKKICDWVNHYQRGETLLSMADNGQGTLHHYGEDGHLEADDFLNDSDWIVRIDIFKFVRMSDDEFNRTYKQANNE